MSLMWGLTPLKPLSCLRGAARNAAMVLLVVKEATSARPWGSRRVPLNGRRRDETKVGRAPFFARMRLA